MGKPATPPTSSRQIFSAVDAFAGEELQFDDITCLVLAFSPVARKSRSQPSWGCRRGRPISHEHPVAGRQPVTRPGVASEFIAEGDPHGVASAMVLYFALRLSVFRR